MVARSRREARKYLETLGDPSVRTRKAAPPPAVPAPAPAPAMPSIPAIPAAPVTPIDPFSRMLIAEQEQKRQAWLQGLIALKPPGFGGCELDQALRRIHARAVRSAKKALGVTRSKDAIRRQGKERARRFRARQKALEAEQMAMKDE